MDRSILKKPKTIKVKYPAPYSQSWTYTEPDQNTRKTSMSQNLKKINPAKPAPYSQSWTYTEPMPNTMVTNNSSRQMTYPAPYFQSWTHTEPIRNIRALPVTRNIRALPVTRNIKALPVTRNKYSTNPLRQSFNLQSQSEVREDFTAPHLKYGMFPSKAGLMRGYYRTLSLKPSKDLSQTSDYPNVRKERKRTPRKGQLVDAPMLIFRPLDKRYTRQLLISEIMHIDIKPRRNPPMSPKNLSPTLSSTPMGKSLR